MILPTREIQPHDVSSHYDDLDELYRLIWGHHVHHGLWEEGNESVEEATLALSRGVAEVAGIREQDRVCDIGCGYGGTSKFLAEEYGAEVSGVTITPKQFELARQRKPRRGKTEFYLRDWLQNDFPDGSFDHAIAIESSEHFQEKDRFFAEAARVLRPGGTLTICAWLASSRPSGIEKDWLLVPICNEGRMPGLGTFDDYRKLYTDHGFQVELSEDLTPKVKRTWSLIIKRMLSDRRGISKIAKTLLNSKNRNRDFIWSPFRLWMAYQTGALRYGLLHGRLSRNS